MHQPLDLWLNFCHSSLGMQAPASDDFCPRDATLSTRHEMILHPLYGLAHKQPVQVNLRPISRISGVVREEDGVGCLFVVCLGLCAVGFGFLRELAGKGFVAALPGGLRFRAAFLGCLEFLVGELAEFWAVACRGTVRVRVRVGVRVGGGGVRGAFDGGGEKLTHSCCYGMEELSERRKLVLPVMEVTWGPKDGERKVCRAQEGGGRKVGKTNAEGLRGD